MKHQEENLEICTVTGPQVGERLDKFLSAQFPDHSRSYFQYLIESSCVLINNKPAKKREKLALNDQIEIQFLAPPEISLEPQEIPLDILYEDEHLIVINKPAGLVVHPGPGNPSGTLVNALLFHCKELEGTDPIRPGIVHRLDKETSGVLVAAKHLSAHAKLTELFASRQVHKEYTAICSGHPKEGLIDAPIGRHPRRRQEMSINETHGKPAQSRIEILAKTDKLSLVKVELLTGRTHQIRVHLKHLAAPVLGDPVYGHTATNTKLKICRQQLHASNLCFTHPFTGKPLSFTAPLPADMKQAINTFFP